MRGLYIPADSSLPIKVVSVSSEQDISKRFFHGHPVEGISRDLDGVMFQSQSQQGQILNSRATDYIYEASDAARDQLVFQDDRAGDVAYHGDVVALGLDFHGQVEDVHERVEQYFSDVRQQNAQQRLIGDPGIWTLSTYRADGSLDDCVVDIDRQAAIGQVEDDLRDRARRNELTPVQRHEALKTIEYAGRDNTIQVKTPGRTYVVEEMKPPYYSQTQGMRI